jgi:molybdopterin-guanine dinucleotide biosynthesis protein A
MQDGKSVFSFAECYDSLMPPTGGPAEDAAAVKLTGFVLVGGRSSRMGRDKALLPFGTVPLAAHVAEIVKQVADDVFLVGSPSLYAPLGHPVLPDLYPGFGPVGAIATALAATDASWNVVVACDLPFVTVDVLRLLLAEALGTGAGCAFAADPDGKGQPLCGVYHASTGHVFQAAVREGEHRLTQVAARLRPHVVHLNDFEALRNVNTPDDWDAVVNR